MTPEFGPIAIVGPGAMGLMHAAYLARQGLNVALVDHRSDRAQRLTANGFIVEDETGQWQAHVPCHATPDFGPVDLLLVFVKAYVTREALTRARPLIGPRTRLLTLQNGLGNLEVLQDFQTPEYVLAGTTSSGATLIGEGRVRVAAVGQMVVGGTEAAALAEVFSAAGLPATTTDDVPTVLWRKAVVNSAINPLTALTGLRNGQLLDIPALRSLLRQVAQESATVGRTLGHGLCPARMPDEVEEICRLTANNRSSMLQDLSAGRRTEVEQINGEIAAAAREAGLSAPLNATLAALVRAASQR
ncbi:MAG: 2-dehydropantoate 2-reductase [Armatimonadetes bacterium]|nr:2-dehydropantoate 2-reductase [Armatimonadota bacterium]